MQKGYKREGKGMAVLRCFFGLFTIIVIVLLAVFMLKLDYSDKLDPSTTMRPYVEVTPTPSVDPSATDALGVVPVTTTEATAVPTPTPTPKPTAVPTPTPSPTPVPTAIPTESYCAVKLDLACPALSANTGKMGITHSYVSSADGNRVIQLQGYAYIDHPEYDAATSQLYLVMTQESTGRQGFAKLNMTPGITGLDHADAQCMNATSGEFEAVIDVSKFAEDIYSLGMVISYLYNGKTRDEYFTFPEGVSFTVLGGQIISDVPLTIND